MADDYMKIMERPFEEVDAAGESQTVLELRDSPATFIWAHDPRDIFEEEEVRRKVAKLLVFGFKGKSVNSHARKLISLGAGGVILFHKNVEDPFQVAELCAELKREAGDRHLITMVDQEGGAVQRVGPPFTSIPSARRVGLTGDSSAAGVIGSVLGKELRTLHIDMNLAPVLDVDTSPPNPVILSRSFGGSPELVAEMGYEFTRALQREGVAACGKHYPGLGNTSVDSHLGLPSLPCTLNKLDEVEMPPFKKAVEADIAAIMIGHVNVPAFMKPNASPQAFLPATMSPAAINHLRTKLLFEGLVISDSLEMGAILKHYTIEDAALQALLAGVDMLLVCHTKARQLRVIDNVTEAVRTGILPYERLREAGERVDYLANTYCRRPPPRLRSSLQQDYQTDRLRVIGCKEHRNVVANVLHHIVLAEAANEHKLKHG